jgi:hypothetical protein
VQPYGVAGQDPDFANLDALGPAYPLEPRIQHDGAGDWLIGGWIGALVMGSG